MIGQNSIKLNQETVMAAVQAYLDEHIAPKVILVDFTPTTYSPYQYDCKVSDTTPPAPEPPKENP